MEALLTMEDVMVAVMVATEDTEAPLVLRSVLHAIAAVVVHTTESTTKRKTITVSVACSVGSEGPHGHLVETKKVTASPEMPGVARAPRHSALSSTGESLSPRTAHCHSASTGEPHHTTTTKTKTSTFHTAI